MLLSILIIAIFIVGGWFAYSKFAKKRDSWAGVPIMGTSSIESSVKGSGNYNPVKITDKNTPKGVDFLEDSEFIEK